MQNDPDTKPVAMELPQAPAERTDVGSYFIANYPPFSAWAPEHLPAAIEALNRSPSTPRTQTPPRPSPCQGEGEGPPLGLYLHIPFCRKRCTFCYFRVYTDKNAAEVEAYAETLAKEVALYADRPGLAGRQFEFVYFGGGTPSFLSDAQLKRLIARINEHWNWSAAKEVTFECEPGTLKESKVRTIREIGVTRLSLGVEHFDDDILSTNGRAHRSPEIFQAWEWIRATGFKQVNIDLIAGMVGETDDKWKTAVEKAIKLDPDSVTIYQMELPFNTVISKAARESGEAPPVADWATKRRWVKYAYEQFESAGYRVSSAYTLVKPLPNAGFVYRDSLWHGADLIGTGVASFSHFGGIHYQNVDTWEQYVGDLERGELPLSRALPLTPHQLLIREMILQLKTGRLERAYFRDKFGQDPLEPFRTAFDELQAEGYANIDRDQILLTRDGLLGVDALLPRFFEKKYRGVRYT